LLVVHELVLRKTDTGSREGGGRGGAVPDDGFSPPRAGMQEHKATIGRGAKKSWKIEGRCGRSAIPRKGRLIGEVGETDRADGTIIMEQGQFGIGGRGKNDSAVERSGDKKFEGREFKTADGVGRDDEETGSGQIDVHANGTFVDTSSGMNFGGSRVGETDGITCIGGLLPVEVAKKFDISAMSKTEILGTILGELRGVAGSGDRVGTGDTSEKPPIFCSGFADFLEGKSILQLSAEAVGFGSALQGGREESLLGEIAGFGTRG